MRDALLNFLARLVWRRPVTILVISAALAALGALYAAQNLKLNANTDDLIARDRPYMREYRRFLDEFGDLEYIHVVVTNAGDASRAQACVEALTLQLKQIAELPGVYGWIEPEEQLHLATGAMPEDELEGLAQATQAIETLIAAESARSALAKASELLQQLVQRGRSISEDEQRNVGASAVLLLKAVAAGNEQSTARQELASLLPAAPQREYFTSDTGQLYFITINPLKDYSTLSVIEEPLRRIRAVIAGMRAQFPELEIGLTGKPVLQADEMATTNDDMILASLIAFVLCAILFMLMIGGVLRPLLAVIAFAIASCWTYGLATLMVGQLNLLSIVFMLVLIGVGLDYGVHVISRYKEWRLTHNVRESIGGAMITAVKGNITGALTSSTVFFMALFTHFQGLRELGVIAGVGLLLCLLAMATVLPALLAISDRRRSDADLPWERGRGAKPQALTDEQGPIAWVARHAGWVLIVAIAFSIALILAPGRIRFERNLLELQAQGLESIEWEHRVLEDSASSTWFGAIIAPTLERVREVQIEAQRHQTIGKVRSVLDVIALSTPRREHLRQQLGSIPLAPSRSTPQTQPDAAGWERVDLERVIASLDLIVAGAALRAPEEATMLKQLRDELNAISTGLTPQMQAAIDETVQRIGVSLRLIVEGDRMSLRAALPASLRAQFVSPWGNFLVMLHPRDDVWEYGPMREFVRDLRAIDSNATGPPITHFESLDEMFDAFIRMSILALLVIVILLTLDFRNWRDLVLALVPLALGLLWMVETMGLLGVSFNLANFFSVPILIGLGIDSSVHILHRYHENPSAANRFSLGSTRRAVILSALTTIIGFGCLILAQHRGLRSLGIAMALGSSACMVSSVVVLPALLAWIERVWPRKR